MSHVSLIALTATGKQAALKDSSPTVRLPRNLENRGTAAEYISHDRDRLSAGKIDRLGLTGTERQREVLSTGEIKSFALDLPSTNSNLIPSPGLAKNLFLNPTYTHNSMARHGRTDREVTGRK